MKYDYLVKALGFTQLHISATTPKKAVILYYEKINNKVQPKYSKYRVQRISDGETNQVNTLSVINNNSTQKGVNYLINNSSLFYIASLIELSMLQNFSIEERYKIKMILKSPFVIRTLKQQYEFLSIPVQKFLIRQNLLVKDALVTTKEPLLIEIVKQGKYINECIKLNRGLGLVSLVAAERGYALDKFWNAFNPQLRSSAAQHKYKLDKLANDTESCVREEVARQGYALQKLISDTYESVRLAARVALNGADPKYINTKNINYVIEMAKQGLCADLLAKDTNVLVRQALAERGFALDLLLDDPNDGVRLRIIRRGYKPEHFINDKNQEISSMARELVVKNLN